MIEFFQTNAAEPRVSASWGPFCAVSFPPNPFSHPARPLEATRVASGRAVSSEPAHRCLRRTSVASDRGSGICSLPLASHHALVRHGEVTPGAPRLLSCPRSCCSWRLGSQERPALERLPDDRPAVLHPRARHEASGRITRAKLPLSRPAGRGFLPPDAELPAGWSQVTERFTFPLALRSPLLLPASLAHS